MYVTKDYLSCWEIAHRWHNFDPNVTGPKKLPLPVQDSIRLLARALRYNQLHVLSAVGTTFDNEKDIIKRRDYVPQKLWSKSTTIDDESEFTDANNELSDDEIDTFGIDIHEEYYDYRETRLKQYNEALAVLDDCYRYRKYDKNRLDAIYFDKDEIFNLCIELNVDPPDFWYSDSDKKELYKFASIDQSEPKKLRNSQIDKLVCRGIAQTLWDIHPDMTIEDMTKHKALQLYGNGAQYKDKKTLRDWIKDLAPDNKPGRRPKTESNKNN